MDVSKTNEAITVHVGNELLPQNYNDLRTEFKRIAEDANLPVELDMREIVFIDSMATGLIIYFYKQLHAKNINLSIVNTNEQPYGLFQLLSLNRLMTIGKKHSKSSA